MRRAAFILVLVLTITLVIGVPAAFAGGPPVINETQHVVNGTDSFDDVDPCTGAPAHIALSFRAVEHLTVLGNGTGHFTETSTGTFAFDYLGTNGKPDGVIDGTGRFTEWHGANGTFGDDGNPLGKAEFAFTLNGKGTRSDGTVFRFHNNGHVNFDPAGHMRAEFFKSHCV